MVISPALRTGFYPPGTVATPVVTMPAGKPTAPAITPLKFDAAKLTSNVRTIYDELVGSDHWFYLDNDDRVNKVGNHTFWNKSMIPTPENEGRVWRWDSYNGERYKRSLLGKVGAYWNGRSTTGVNHTVVGLAYEATKLSGMPDFRILDTGCAEAIAYVGGLRDESGIESDKPDGFLSIPYGSDACECIFIAPDHFGNTAIVLDGKIRYSNEGNGNEGMKKLSGVDKKIEDANSLGITTAGLEAHLARTVYSPTYESEGKRPAKPEFYGKVADDVFGKFYESMRNKWLKHKGDPENKKGELPIMHELTHGRHVEMCSEIEYAIYKYGENFKDSDIYKNVERVFWTLHGEARRVGNTSDVDAAYFYEGKHPKWGTFLVLGHFAKTKSDGQIPHPNAYTGTTYGALLRMKSLGCDFVTNEMLRKLANTMKATLSLGNVFERLNKPTHVPYLMNGNNMVPELASPWAKNKSNSGAFQWVLVTGAMAGMAAYDDTGELERLIKRDYDAYLRADPRKAGKQTYGAASGLLYCSALKAA